MIYDGEFVPFYQQDVKPFVSQYLCGGTSGWARADNNYIVHLFLLLHLTSKANIGIQFN